MNNDEAIYKSLKKVYPNDVDELFDVVIRKIDCFNKKHKQCHRTKLEDINGILITYADTLKGEASPLSVLTDFLLKYCGSAFNTIHILPFFPYSSDDGFSVIDYKKVNPQCGNWEDVEELSAHYHLMFDAVINHISQKSDWFQGFLNSKMDYEDFFIELESEEGLSQVTRPRATPLLTSFETKNGKKKVWTTFSSDQIDLNYKNPKLLLKIIDILLFYIEKGASLIRLDAIGYLWKELATSCIHLTQTHEIVRLFRSIVDALNKNALLITETNVPHSENISYFGNGTNEAHMVYNFSLPPLILHAYLQQSSNELNQWVTNLEDPGLEATYFNFLASHDGIGLMPLKGLIKPDEVDSLVQKCLKNHGRISYKQNTDGTEIPYEMNINYFDALSDCSHSEEYNIKKFLGAYAVAISLKGIPGIYIHSLLGSQNWEEGILKNGHNRAINREKIDFKSISQALSNNWSKRYQIFNNLKKMLELRASQKSLSYKAKQKCIIENPRVFIIKRSYDDEELLVIVNLSEESQVINLSQINGKGHYKDLLSGYDFSETLRLAPYSFYWLKPQRGVIHVG